jgi:hypothetical protein
LFYLILAIVNYHTDIAIALINAGANVNGIDAFRKGPLEYGRLSL